MSGPIRMTPEDSAFWKMESDTSRMHSVTLASFAGPAPEFEELKEHVGHRVPLVPHFRHRVEEIPLDLGRPMWVDDPTFDLDNHIVTATATVGSAGLTELVSLIVSEQLDRSRPLWELTMVTDLPGDGWALVSKVHHSTIDGLFGTEPLAVLIDGAVSNPISPSGWNPRRPPTKNELVGRTVTELLANPVEQYRFARASLRRAKRNMERLVGRTVANAEIDPTGLRGPVGGARTWTSFSVPMDSIRRERDRLGVNTHELVLALVTNGIRDLLISRDEAGEDWPVVKAIVPMAVAGSSGGLYGGIAAEIVELPTEVPDLADQVGLLHKQTPGATANPVGIDAQIGLTGFSAPALASLGLREATRRGTSERGAHITVINVPGPRHELTMLGRPMTDIYPVPPLAAGLRLSVGVYSYLDTLYFGVTADRQGLPDARLVTTGIRRAIEQVANPEQETKHATS